MKSVLKRGYIYTHARIYIYILHVHIYIILFIYVCLYLYDSARAGESHTVHDTIEIRMSLVARLNVMHCFFFNHNHKGARILYCLSEKSKTLSERGRDHSIQGMGRSGKAQSAYCKTWSKMEVDVVPLICQQ